MKLPVAILCGGKGTRAGLPINKCFVDVAGKPFILRLMDQLEEYGFTTIVCCRGEEGRLEALRNARRQLGERFIVLYGDTYLPLDFSSFVDSWNYFGKPAITAEHKGVDADVNGYATYLLDHATSLAGLKAKLNREDLIHHYPVAEQWHQVGDPKGLEEAQEWFREKDAWRSTRTTSTAYSRQEPKSSGPMLLSAEEPSESMTYSLGN